MNKHGFKLHVADLLSLSLEGVKDKLKESSAKLADIHFMDLFVEHRPGGEKWPMSSGVYLFFNPEGVCTYVGLSKQSFATRIGAHLGNRTVKNLYLRDACPHKEGRYNGYIDEHYVSRIDQLSTHELALVNVYNLPHIKDRFIAAGVEAAEFERVYPEPWSVRIQKLRAKMERALQAAFCPYADKDHGLFLNKPIRRGGLHKFRDRMEGMPDANFAQLLLL